MNTTIGRLSFSSPSSIHIVLLFMIRLLMLSSSPTKPLSWWEDSDILGGRDEVAGGTWLACTRTGRLAFLTNVREINSNSHTKSRGDLPLRFLKVINFYSFSYPFTWAFLFIH